MGTQSARNAAKFLLPLLLAACSPASDQTDSEVSEDVEVSGNRSASSSGFADLNSRLDREWIFRSSTDPMTDEVSRFAVRKFASAPYVAGVRVDCSLTGEVSYTVSTFHRSGRAEKPNSTSNWSDYLGRMMTGILYEYRLDDQPARSGVAVNPRNGYEFRVDIGGAADARRIVLRVPFSDSDGTFEIDQSDSAMRSFLESCQSTRIGPSGDSNPIEADVAAPSPTEIDSSLED